MIANTHRLVGEFLYRQLTPMKQALLHKRRFVYGNIKPDISKNYIRMSHYYRDNKEIIFEMFENLLKEPASLSDFSENLGVLIHFFCDYACIYHANDYLHDHHSIAKHVKYEIMLHRYASKKFKRLETVKVIPFQNINEIQEYVYKLTFQLNQLKLTRSVSQDFEDMMILSVSVMQYIMNHYEFDKLLLTHHKKRH
ncbi:MAG: zinc dependent phospholipase C family protein [Turicibacter sp.]|nr:zinc dependent phospholipase C family protein [Turicibacter sp.]